MTWHATDFRILSWFAPDGSGVSCEHLSRTHAMKPVLVMELSAKALDTSHPVTQCRAEWLNGLLADD